MAQQVDCLLDDGVGVTVLKQIKTERSLGMNLRTTVNATYAFTTWQRDHNELYKPSTHSNLEQKMKYRQEYWPIDLQNAFDAGVRLVAQRIQNNNA